MNDNTDDLVQRLRNPAYRVGAAHLDEEKTLADLKAAADRIEKLEAENIFLRKRAGAVSDGPDLAELRERINHSEGGILKA